MYVIVWWRHNTRLEEFALGDNDEKNHGSMTPKS